MRLSEKVAIVTGGGRGIGKAYCLALAREGAAVVVADIAVADARDVAGEITSNSGRAIAVRTDVTDLSSLQSMAQATAQAFGGIDILVNNAAMFSNLTRKAWDESTPEEWDQVMAVNAKGPWMTCLAVVPYLKQRGAGKIINIGSASIYSADSRLVHYVSSKGAVMALTRVLARELGPFNIHVNCLEPGQTMSGTNDQNTPQSYVQAHVARRCIQRVQRADDLVGTLLFLASGDSDFMTGQSLLVDGGVFFVG